MVTEAQILANRRNAQKSTGPRTIEGKAAVSQNAVQHGFSARQDVISSESQVDFDQYRDRILAELDPASPMESMLAERIVGLSWRLKRICSIQNQAIDALNADNTPTLGQTHKIPVFQRPEPAARGHLRIGHRSGSRPFGYKGLLKCKGPRPSLDV